MYQQLPMGIAFTPDMFKSIIQDLDADLYYVLIYIDDILIIKCEDETEKDHLCNIKIVLKQLEESSFKANLWKSFFIQKEVKYLDYQITSEGLKLQLIKIDAIQQILPSINSKQLKQFIDMIKFYCNIWEKESHILAPFTNLVVATGKKEGMQQEKY